MAAGRFVPSPCTSIVIPLNQDIDQVAVLVDGPPQVVAFASDLHEDLVQVPDIAQPTLTTVAGTGSS